MVDTREILLQYVREHIERRYDPAKDSLLDLLDSVRLLQLVMFIEARCGVTLDMAELDLDVFASLETLVAAVGQRQAKG